ncbi:MAG: divergent polysaccharide deacetylase family protein [Sinobacterium sp.]|nr:divergent polysaccharide deacetylase family protein [Sinobacterium sp.]
MPALLAVLFISLPLRASNLENYAVSPPTYQPVKRLYRFSPQKTKKPRIAIIIDDIGYNIPLGQRAVNLKGQITLAVLPKTPGAKLLAQAGFESGKEIMLHAPMSNMNEFKLGPGALTEDLSKDEFLRVLNEDIDNIPHIVGVNNHMGSSLTTQKKQMSWVMATLKQRELYFIDSLTHGSSVAYITARRHGLVTSQRDIFLDHTISELMITQQVNRLIQRAHDQGYAIGIGHPYPETLAVLERMLPLLEENGIELVHVSTLIDPNKKH